MKRTALSLSIAALLTTVAVWAVAAQGTGIGSFEPFAIHITHEEPITVVATSTTTAGEVVTITTPITVGVDLRIDVFGPGVVSVESAGATASATEVTSLATPAAGAAEMGGLSFEVLSAENAGSTYDEDDNFRAIEALGGDLLVLHFALTNQTNEPIDLSMGDVGGSIGDLRLENAAGQQFGLVSGAFDSQCDYSKTAQPGIPSKCAKVFEVPDGNAEYVLILLDKDSGEVGRVAVPAASE